MKVALGQFKVVADWQENADRCIELMNEAETGGAKLLLLPEAVLARDITDPMAILKSAQALDGPFMQQILKVSQKQMLTTIFTINVPAVEGKVSNALVVIKDGEIIARYDKLHLYDAFAVQESLTVSPGEVIPDLVEIGGYKVGLMTCYDLRFPELARSLALKGADLFVAPSAWVRGPQKEHHWKVLTTARALENTCYMLAVSECGSINIGNSLAIDPLGIVMAQMSEMPGLIFVELHRERLEMARAQLPVLKNSRFSPPQLKKSL